MSWGHATSKDLSHWEEQPIALLARGFPDNITEMFFTGSAVADVNNTSGLGADVAVYTSFVSLKENTHELAQVNLTLFWKYPITHTLRSGKSVKANQQSQSLVYSLDDGLTWQTYDSANPVIQTPPPKPYEDQYQNFRDPFIFWHEQTHRWVLVTALSEIRQFERLVRRKRIRPF
ncbi:Extracellular exo-inulinase inuE [Penicillium maclennaniae]|uniref:Extracellular exo-inulinase inuE n=1 Tax=Penicillium maclennaniae TaxID=1343394 RepID=UPI0025422DB4|nr:Extracellular exo-inulinase inuE [Penicillium maclennaniae]KAJ5665439.1 Extracellular exo-inulinase inuE [Penicillium maclennaniae]